MANVKCPYGGGQVGNKAEQGRCGRVGKIVFLVVRAVRMSRPILL